MTKSIYVKLRVYSKTLKQYTTLPLKTQRGTKKPNKKPNMTQEKNKKKHATKFEFKKSTPQQAQYTISGSKGGVWRCRKRV